jgi:hypothetical protein
MKLILHKKMKLNLHKRMKLRPAYPPCPRVEAPPAG